MSTNAVLTDELIATISEHAEEVCMTEGMDRDTWLKTRKPFIGASEAAAALGLSPWESQFGLFVDKTTDSVSDEDNDYMRWGRRLEEAIGLGISEDTGIPVVRYPYMMKSKEWPWMAVNVDFLAPNSVVEVKNVSTHLASEWADGAVPAHYGLQGQHACAVLGLPGVHFFPLIGGHEGRPVYVERNDRLIENLVEGERKFWDLVLSNTPPAIDGSDASTRAVKSLFVDPDADSELDLSDRITPDGRSISDLLDLRAEAKSAIKGQQEIVKEVENQLFYWLGNCEIATVDGVTAFTWRKQYRAGYVVEPTSFRKIYVPKPKKK